MHPWLFTKWLSEFGISDLIAAVGTVAAVFFALWQADAGRRERRDASKAVAAVALAVIERGIEVLDGKATPTFVGSHFAGLHATMLEIPVAQLPTADAAKAVFSARAAMVVLSDRGQQATDDRRAGGYGGAIFFSTMDQHKELQLAANLLRKSLGVAEVAYVWKSPFPKQAAKADTIETFTPPADS
jgi:hypothetical protein